MPKYSYKCRDCSNKFEAVTSIKDHESKKKTVCPKCKSENTKQTFSLKNLFLSDKDEDKGKCCCSGKCE